MRSEAEKREGVLRLPPLPYFHIEPSRPTKAAVLQQGRGLVGLVGRNAVGGRRGERDEDQGQPGLVLCRFTGRCSCRPARPSMTWRNATAIPCRRHTGAALVAFWLVPRAQVA